MKYSTLYVKEAPVQGPFEQRALGYLLLGQYKLASKWYDLALINDPVRMKQLMVQWNTYPEAKRMEYYSKFRSLDSGNLERYFSMRRQIYEHYEKPMPDDTMALYRQGARPFQVAREELDVRKARRAQREAEYKQCISGSVTCWEEQKYKKEEFRRACKLARQRAAYQLRLAEPISKWWEEVALAIMKEVMLQPHPQFI